MADELMITPAAEWNRVREGVAMRLPSGRVARIRPFSFETLVRAGRIPEGMVPLVSDIMQGERDDLPAAETLADIQDRLAFLDAMVMSAFVEPRVVSDDPPPDGCVHIDALEQIDKEYMFALLNRPLRELERFRDEQGRAVEPVGVAEGHDATGEPTPEPDGVGEA